jgi:hypothetical protein
VVVVVLLLVVSKGFLGVVLGGVAAGVGLKKRE